MRFLAYLLIPFFFGIVLASINKEVIQAEKNMDENHFAEATISF